MNISSKSFYFSIVLWLFAGSVASPLFADSGADHLLGYWQAEGKPAIVEISKADDGSYSGAVVANDTKPETIGKQVLKDLHYAAATQQWNGAFHLIERDKQAKASISSSNPENFEMKVKLGFMSRTLN